MSSEQKKQTVRAYLFEYDEEAERPKLPRLVDVEYVYYEEEQRWEPTLESIRDHIGPVMVDRVRVNEHAVVWIDDEGRLKDPAYVNIFLRNDQGVFDICRTCLMTLEEPAPCEAEGKDSEEVAKAKRAAEDIVLGLYAVYHIRPGGTATPAAEPKIEVKTFNVEEFLAEQAKRGS